MTKRGKAQRIDIKNIVAEELFSTNDKPQAMEELSSMIFENYIKNISQSDKSKFKLIKSEKTIGHA